MPIFRIDIDECKCGNRHLDLDNPVHRQDNIGSVVAAICINCRAWVLLACAVKRGWDIDVVLR